MSVAERTVILVAAGVVLSLLLGAPAHATRSRSRRGPPRSPGTPSWTGAGAGLPGTVAVIVAGTFVKVAFRGCRSLSEICRLTSPTLASGRSPGARPWARSAAHPHRDWRERLLRMHVLEITLPPKPTEIGGSAFSGCTSLSEICRPPSPRQESTPAAGVRPCARSATQPHRDWRACLLRMLVLERDLPPGAVDIGHDAFAHCPGTPQRPLAPLL